MGGKGASRSPKDEREPLRGRTSGAAGHNHFIIPQKQAAQLPRSARGARRCGGASYKSCRSMSRGAKRRLRTRATDAAPRGGSRHAPPLNSSSMTPRKHPKMHRSTNFNAPPSCRRSSPTSVPTTGVVPPTSLAALDAWRARTRSCEPAAAALVHRCKLTRTLSRVGAAPLPRWGPAPLAHWPHDVPVERTVAVETGTTVSISVHAGEVAAIGSAGREFSAGHACSSVAQLHTSQVRALSRRAPRSTRM